MKDILESIHFTHGYWIIVLPVFFMALDILTGLVYAWISKTFQSAKMRAGLAKKFGELAYIIIGVMTTYALDLPTYIVIGISVYICFMELMSIMENCDKLGAPIPAAAKAVLNNIGEALEHDDLPTLKEKAEKAEKELTE